MLLHFILKFKRRRQISSILAGNFSLPAKSMGTHFTLCGRGDCMVMEGQIKRGLTDMIIMHSLNSFIKHVLLNYGLPRDTSLRLPSKKNSVTLTTRAGSEKHIKY